MGFWSLISSRLNLNPTFLWETAKGLGQVISFVAHRNLRREPWVLGEDQTDHVVLRHCDESKSI
jgi:hypothetical protein